MLKYFNFKLNTSPLTIKEINEENDKNLYFIYKTPDRFLDIFYNSLLDTAALPLVYIYIIYKII